MYLDSRGMLPRSRRYHFHRKEARYVSTIPVTLQRFLRFGPSVTRGVTLDVSSHGMSALVCGAPQVGETVVIALSLPETAIEMLATVRHSNNAKSGFQFYPLSPNAEQGIQQWIRELGKHEETMFPYPYSAAVKLTDPEKAVDETAWRQGREPNLQRERSKAANGVEPGDDRPMTEITTSLRNSNGASAQQR